MARKMFLILFLCASLAACKEKMVTGPSDPGNPPGSGSGGGPSGIPPWPSPEPGIPPPGLENYTSADGLVKIYVIGFNPARNSQIFAGGRAEIYFQIIYSQEGKGMLTVTPLVVNDPLENPDQPGRVSPIFGGENLKPGANEYRIAGTFLVPVAESIPYIRLCAGYDGWRAWCNINIQVGWHP